MADYFIVQGLSAAKELRAYGLGVIVLEARERVGGRTLTKREPSSSNKDDNKDVFWVDLGGSYVGPTQNSLLNLVEELKLETYLVDDSQSIGYLRQVKQKPKKWGQSRSNDGMKLEIRSKFNPDQDPPFGNLFHWLDYVNMVKLIDCYGAQIPSEAPWLAKKAQEWDSMSYKEFVDNNTWTKRVRSYFNNIFVTIDVCCEPNEVSMLWFLWYVKQCGGYGRTIATTNGGQERKIKNGTQQVSEKLFDLIGGNQRVFLNKPVCSIDQTLGPFVVVRTTDGSVYKANYLICAISPHLWLKIHHEPALPSGKNLLAQRSPMGQVAKVVLYYERPFWKDPPHNYSGCFMFDAQDRSKHPVILSLDDTKLDGSHPAIIGFVNARGWYEMREKSNQEIGKVIGKTYADLTGLNEFLNFIRVERFDWTAEQYSGGCYTSTHCVNTLTKFGPYLRQPFGRIYYAGTETAIKWSGYMDGAISAGKRAAREILHVTGNLNEDEIWVEEPASEIVPPRPFEYPNSHRYASGIGCILKLSTSLIVISGIVLALMTFKQHQGYRIGF